MGTSIFGSGKNSYKYATTIEIGSPRRNIGISERDKQSAIANAARVASRTGAVIEKSKGKVVIRHDDKPLVKEAVRRIYDSEYNVALKGGKIEVNRTSDTRATEPATTRKVSPNEFRKAAREYENATYQEDQESRSKAAKVLNSFKKGAASKLLNRINSGGSADEYVRDELGRFAEH